MLVHHTRGHRDMPGARTCQVPGHARTCHATAKEPYLAGKVLAFGMPVEIAATASAPKDVPKTKQTNGVKK